MVTKRSLTTTPKRSSLPEEARCPFFASFLPFPETPAPVAPIEPDTQTTLFYFFLFLAFCLGSMICFFVWRVRGLWKVYEFRKGTIQQSYTPTPPARSEMEVLKQELLLRGLTLRSVKGDGNCLFRAVAFQCSKNEDDFAEFRACAVRTMRTNGGEYMPFVGGPAKEYQAYLKTMAQNKVFGTQLEIVALAKALGRPIRVW